MCVHEVSALFQSWPNAQIYTWQRAHTIAPCSWDLGNGKQEYWDTTEPLRSWVSIGRQAHGLKKKSKQMLKIKLTFHEDTPFYVTSAGQSTLTLPLPCSTLKEPCAFPSAEIWQKGQQLDPGPFRHAQRETTTESKAEAARPEGPRLLSPGRSPHFTGQLSKLLLKVLKDKCYFVF